jgi:hypothetical protein
MKNNKLTPTQIKLKKVLKPIVESMLKEGQYVDTPYAKEFITSLEALVEKYKRAGLNYNVMLSILGDFPNVSAE